MRSLIGQTLGQYQIVAPIGAGGMATIYKAYQSSLNRYVAIKILPPDCLPESTFARRFTREAQVAALLDHPNILPIYDFGQQGDISYIAMKFVPTGSLSDKLGQPLPLTEALRLVEHIASALDEAHAHGIVHCDVTPRNLLIDERGWPYLTDFGLSRLVEPPPSASITSDSGTPSATKSAHGQSSPAVAQTDLFALGSVLFEMLTRPRYEGTPAYMSPEQGQGLAVDARADVYALGVILFEMLTGRVLYEADTEMGIVLKQITVPPPRPRQFNPDIPEAVEQVLLKALTKNPAGRFASAGELARALRQAIQSLEPGVAALSDPPMSKPAIFAPDDRPRLPLSLALVSSRPRGGSWLPAIIGGGVITAVGLCLLVAWLIYLIGQAQ